jgi:hypothetical protein
MSTATAVLDDPAVTDPMQDREHVAVLGEE